MTERALFSAFLLPLHAEQKQKDMEKQEPKLMSLSEMRNIFEPHQQKFRDGIFINDEMAILRGNPDIFRLVMRQKPPFSINDYRMGIVLNGCVDANINLVEKHVEGPCLMFLGPGTIIHPRHFSDDLEIYGFALSNRFPMPFTAQQMPAALNGHVRDFQLPVSEADISTALHIIHTLWHVVHQPDYNRLLVSNLVAAQMHHYDALYRQYVGRQQVSKSREQTIFDRFIQLVNQHAVKEHQIAFYASRMCITERYLGTVIRQASGVTAKEWIDRAVISRVKVELRHTDKSVASISDEMNFPNPSFFSKYFKRLTQMTPNEYRES